MYSHSQLRFVRPAQSPLSARRSSGFTLVELMVVVAIIGLITAIAMPSYTDYVLRGRIPDATTNLATQRVKLEQYFQDSKTYTGAPACIANDITTSANFNFSCQVAANGLGYTLTAQGKGSMLGFTYTVDQSNARTSAVPSGSGWTLPSPNTCWVTSKTGSC